MHVAIIVCPIRWVGLDNRACAYKKLFPFPFIFLTKFTIADLTILVCGHETAAHDLWIFEISKTSFSFSTKYCGCTFPSTKFHYLFFFSKQMFLLIPNPFLMSACLIWCCVNLESNHVWQWTSNNILCQNYLQDNVVLPHNTNIDFFDIILLL